ncbi:MAG: Si-specific NAD(P)(+) transhydrogenase [Planctomycetaceae bacterium]
MSVLNYDLIVIGGGPAGSSGAEAGAYCGKRVALVERHRELGGAGINSGTIPSKTLRETALALSGWRSRRLYGVDLSLRHTATIAEFTHHRDHVEMVERRRVALRLERTGVERFHGTAGFIDPYHVRVVQPDGTEIRLKGEKILIATGSTPRRPPEFPFADKRILDSDQLMQIESLPRRLVVVGAGVIGSEYASTFTAMSVEVQLVDGRDVLLPFLDGEVSQALAKAMQASGVQFHLSDRVVQCDTSRPDELRITLKSGRTLPCDKLLVCAGRASHIAELNLCAAGIAPGERNLIPVDAQYRSVVPHIFAAGDVIGAPGLAATGMEQARVAVCHAFGVSLKADLTAVLPIGVYTIPEASMAGATEETLKKQGVDYIVGRARYADNVRGRIVGDDSGFLKLLFRRQDMRLLGAHVVGEHASEIVHIGLMALLTESGAELFNRICFNYPTLGDLYKYATYDAIGKRSQ